MPEKLRFSEQEKGLYVGPTGNSRLAVTARQFEPATLGFLSFHSTWTETPTVFQFLQAQLFHHDKSRT